MNNNGNIFSEEEKQSIAIEIEKLLVSFNNPKMPKEKLRFYLHVKGESEFWDEIEPYWVK